jgi:hypothetical protein
MKGAIQNLTDALGSSRVVRKVVRLENVSYFQAFKSEATFFYCPLKLLVLQLQHFK